MTWARLDDRFPWHRKVRPISDAAFRLHVSAICWSAEHLTDGRVLVAELPLASDVKKPRPAVAELVRAGLWDETEDGWAIHDYLFYNPDAERVKARREADAERQRRGRMSRQESQRESRRDTPRDSDQTSGVSPLVPSRPVPKDTPNGVSSRSRATAKAAITEDWQPSDDDLAWAADKAPLVNIERETERFVGYFLDKGVKRPGWSRSWRSWMSEAQTRSEQRPLRAVGQQFDWQALGRQGSWDQ